MLKFLRKFLFNTVLYNHEDYFYLVKQKGQTIQINIKNHKDYGGYCFERFSCSLSEEKMLERIKEYDNNASYSEDTKEIKFEYKDTDLKLVREDKERYLWTIRYYYIFSEVD